MAGALAASIIVFATGAVLDFAFTTNANQHGWDIPTIGVILMAVGAAGALLSMIGFLFGAWPRRHRTTVQDGSGNVVRRDDTYV
jgi:hypothetical protein